jgi:hypothetical protein
LILSAQFLIESNYYSGYSKDDWRGFSGIMQKTTNPGDFVVLVPGYISQPFNYYYSNTTDRTFEFSAYTANDLDAIDAQKNNNTTVYFIVTGDIYSADPSGDALAWLKEHTTQLGQDTGIAVFVSGASV